MDPEPPLIGVDHLQRTQETRISIEQLARSLTKSISHSRVNPCVERPLLIISGRVPWPWARNHVHDWALIDRAATPLAQHRGLEKFRQQKFGFECQQLPVLSSVSQFRRGLPTHHTTVSTDSSAPLGQHNY